MPWYDRFDREAARLLPDLPVREEVPMADYTTFRVGGPARRLAAPRSPEELAALLELAQAEDFPRLTLGNGSNLLVADQGLDRLVIYTGDTRRVEAGPLTNQVTAEAGASLAAAAVFAQRRALAGLAFAHGIPGTVGGAVCMNAGAYGGEIRQVLESALVWLPGEGVRTLSNEALAFGYRRSLLTDRPEAVVLRAVFSLEPGDPEAIRAEMEELRRRRREKQPLDRPSAGSTFKRPPGHFAGALIEQCGLKGARIGGAQVSEKHAGFVINAGGATCADVLALIRHIRKTVRAETGVTLEPEVKILPEELAREVMEEV